jgi:hypothetical protein
MTTKDVGSTLPTFPSPSTQVGGIKTVGTAVFTGGLTVTVLLPTAEVDTNYKIFITPLSTASRFAVTAKTTTTFTLSCSAASTDSVDWMLLVH